MGESGACSNRTRGNGFKLKEGRFMLDARKKFFTQSGEVLAQVAQRSCGCPSLAVFKARLDGPLSSLI